MKYYVAVSTTCNFTLLQFVHHLKSHTQSFCLTFRRRPQHLYTLQPGRQRLNTFPQEVRRNGEEKSRICCFPSSSPLGFVPYISSVVQPKREVTLSREFFPRRPIHHRKMSVNRDRVKT